MDKKEMMGKWRVPAVCAVFVLLCLWLVWQMFFGRTFHIKETVYVYVDKDDTPDSVGAKINREARPGLLAGFSTLSALTRYQVRSGRYAISPDDNMFSVYKRMKRGSQTPVQFILPSVRTMDRLAGVLGRKLMMDSTEVARLFADSSFCRRYGYDTATLACLFVPNTYEVYWDTAPEDFMKRMQREHDAFWNEDRLAKAQAAGLTPNEVCVLASIVSEETANNGEKPMVTGMYINRLRAGMPLQADPTVKFALQDFGLRRIYHNHLKVDSPYNTYVYAGLPPGPIRIAGIVDIDAVLNYVHHDYLFMCAKEDFSGTHNFARTYREHLANAARYSAALNARGIK